MLNLARKLRADIYTGYIEKEKTFDTKGIRVIELGVSSRLPAGLRHVAIAKKFEKYKFPEYDCYIFSGVWCVTAAKNNHPNLFYCHTPPRYIHDLGKYFMENSNIVKKTALKALIKYWAPKDRLYMNFFDVICPNSENVRRRIKKFYGDRIWRKCRVVYTGIETKRFFYRKSEGFYLATQRLDKLKRLNMIINAFKKMPQKNLIITGTGPEEKNLRRLAQGFKNIRFTINNHKSWVQKTCIRSSFVPHAP